jgi:hypothetical protein
MADQVWEVECSVCGMKLGSNKERCGINARGKRMAKPPCVWAHCEPGIVQKCFTKAAAKKEQQASNDQRDAELRLQMQSGRVFNFEEPLHAVDEAQRAQEELQQQEMWDGVQRENEEYHLQQQLAPHDDTDDETNDDRGRDDADNKDNDAAGTDAKDAKKPIDKKTKWNTITRTMFFKCIQKEDPFNSDNKAACWQKIADAMHQATAVFVNSRDGDLRTYSNGKTLSVFYARCRDQRRKMDDGESHSGVAGGRELDPAVQEERNQLYACMLAERSAKEAVETKREIHKADATFKNGEVNDIVIKCAVNNETVRPKAIKVVASRLRELKMRRLAWEAQERQSGRNGQYTYTAEDLKNFQYWNDLKRAEVTLPEDPTENDDADVAVSAGRGGGLAKAIAAFTEKLATAAQFQPMPVQDFASAFFKAKREHEALTTRSSKQKLDAIASDVLDKTITEEEGKLYKKQVTEAHYSTL